jgi:flagellar L-ring protein precursor FlgH
MTRPAALLAPSILILAAFALGGCGSLDRLSNIGKAPDLAKIEDPTAQPGYKPVRMPMPTPQPVSFAANSLWRQGSRAFFKDQRAQQVGDIVTVKVAITDKAKLDNETKRTRTSSETMGIGNAFGLESKVGSILPGATPGKLINTDSTSSSDGTGSVDRKEELLTNIAAVVTQVLPNGNLVVEGKQEIRVNFEIREMVVAGVIDQDGGGSHRLWRPRSADGRAAAALRPASDGYPPAVLSARRGTVPRPDR